MQFLEIVQLIYYFTPEAAARLDLIFGFIALKYYGLLKEKSVDIILGFFLFDLNYCLGLFIESLFINARKISNNVSFNLFSANKVYSLACFLKESIGTTPHFTM